MPYNPGMGIVRLQAEEQFPQRLFLGRCPGVGRFPAWIQAALVAYPDGTAVVSRGMRPLLVEGTTGMNHTVAGDVVMITHSGKAPGPVTGYDGFQWEGTVATRRTAMNHNQVYLTVILVLAAV